MTRAEHMAWAKARALEYVAAGDNAGALGSLASDLTKDPETAVALEIVALVAMPLMALGQLKTADQMRTWIERLA